MTPALRRLVLLAHIVSSVGFLGAVCAYLALDIAAVVGADVATVRAAYVAMEIVATYAVVPLALVALATGIVGALGTAWGLARHYWVLVKLLLTLLTVVILLHEMGTIRTLAEQARAMADPRSLPGTLPHSGGGLAVLLLVTVLSVYKPRGLTRYGWRRLQSGSGWQILP